MNLKNKGFTILELIVVVAIIGILTSIILFAISDSREKGRNARRHRDAHEIRSALNLYVTDNGTYPTNGSEWEIIIDGTDYLTNDLEGAGYFSEVPLDPLNEGVYVYKYRPEDNARNYNITYCLEPNEECITLSSDDDLEFFIEIQDPAPDGGPPPGP